ncbi:MAG: PhoH family protein [Flavobacteriales bacterium]|nr:PhoH family protein [Flavobacteriales bacterium]
MVAKKKLEKKDAQKIFVLDTSVLLYDSNAIKNFKEHNVAIPIQVLEEIDNFKKGNDTKNFEAREFIRFTDDIAQGQLINDWIPLNGSKTGRFKVVIHNEKPRVDAERVIGEGKYDHKILNCAISLQEEYPEKKVVLVSKDICLRLKAKALNIRAEDYETGKIKNISDLYTGNTTIDKVALTKLDTLRNKGFIKPDEVGIKNPKCNEYFVLRSKDKKQEVLAYYEDDMKALRAIEEYEAFGVKALNPEQQFALHALMNPRVRLVTIQGVAGTGKTLLALASALEQRRDFRQIFVSRPIIPLANNDIGFLPGDVKDKVDPYMQSLWDNLNYIKDQFRKTDKKYRLIEEMQKSEKIAIAPLAYIRGRSLVKIFFVVDEAQNLTPHEVKTIISRAGDDTKIVFMGDIHQIDTPYLDSQSNGLSYLIDRIKDNPLFAHITLQKGERSDLANIANHYL